MNVVGIVGRVVRDAELSQVGETYQVCRFTLAVDGAGDKNNDGSPGYAPGFFEVEAWGKEAEFASKWATKGRPISVAGSLRHHKWVDPQGNNRYKISITASKVSFVAGSKDNTVNTTAEEPTSGEAIDIFLEP